MNVENTNVQMKKGILEYCVLHIISRGEIYTSDLIAELTSARMVVVEGTLYPLLTRLKNAGWLEYKWVESAYGPPRKYYTLTTSGNDMLALLDQTWQEIKQAVSQIVGDKSPTDHGAQGPGMTTNATASDLPTDALSDSSSDQTPALPPDLLIASQQDPETDQLSDQPDQPSTPPQLS